MAETCNQLTWNMKPAYSYVICTISS